MVGHLIDLVDLTSAMVAEPYNPLNFPTIHTR